MIRHLFIGTFKAGISDSVKQKQVADMRAMKVNIPRISALEVGISQGWAGVENTIMMTVDFDSKDDFDIYMEHPYHTEYINQTGFDYFDRSTFVFGQFEV